MRMSSMEVPDKKAEPLEITLDTGEISMTGGRLKQVRVYVRDEAFCFTYTDAMAMWISPLKLYITKPMFG